MTDPILITIPRPMFRYLLAFAIAGFVTMAIGDAGFLALVKVEVERPSPPTLDPNPVCHLVPAPAPKEAKK